MISPPTFISRATSSSVCIKRVSDHLRFRFPFSLRDTVLNSRWLWIFYSQEFFLKGYCWFWQPLLCRRLLNIIGLPLKTRHFQTQLGQVVFKLKKLKVPVDQSSKLKQGLLRKRTILHCCAWKLGRPLRLSKNRLWKRPKSGRFLPVFKVKKPVLIPAISTYLSA